jgi:uncharacterized membrane protein
MRSMTLVGIVLIVLGVAGLAIRTVTYTETEEIVDIGPLELESEEEHTIPIPTIAGIIAVVAGFGLVLAGTRKA